MGRDMTEQTRPAWFDEFLDAVHERRPPNLTRAQIVMGDALMVAKIFDTLESGQARFKEKHGRWPTRTELLDFVLNDDEIQWRMTRWPDCETRATRPRQNTNHHNANSAMMI